MISNTDSTNKKYTLETKIKLFLKWAGVVVFGILSIACALAALVVAINFWFLLFGYPLNVLIPFLQFLAPVLTSYLWTLLGFIIPLAICAVFAFITYKIYKLEIKNENEDEKDKKGNINETNKNINEIKTNEEINNKETNKNINEIEIKEKEDNNIIINKNEIKKEENIDNSKIKKKENKKEDKDKNKKININGKEYEKIKYTNINGEEFEAHVDEIDTGIDVANLYINVLNKRKDLNVLFGGENLKKGDVKIKTKSVDKITQLCSNHPVEMVLFTLHKEENKGK